jgi:NOL1/NOP2/fmu family ribosome biogenesis protein
MKFVTKQAKLKLKTQLNQPKDTSRQSLRLTIHDKRTLRWIINLVFCIQQTAETKKLEIGDKVNEAST